jgi:hypothetical protein
MNITKKLIELITYYGATRQVGHTTLLKEGTKHYDRPFFVLTHNMNYGMDLGLSPKDVISLTNLDKLQGHNRPLAIDNAVIIELLSDALMKIESLEMENAELIKRNQLLIIPYRKKLQK